MPARKRREELEVFHAYLRQNGLKKTYQKDLILDTFLQSEGHMSIEDVYSRARRRDRKVGIVTVFRTLKSLTACGIAREIHLGDGLTRFEHSYHHPHHHHIVCTECHKAIEFVAPELERVQGEIVDKYHFQPVHHHLQVYGVCEDCRLSRRSNYQGKYDSERVFARDALALAISMEKRGIELYREGAARNRDQAGSEVFAAIAQEASKHLAKLESDMESLLQRDKAIGQAPAFLHFDPRALDRILPDLAGLERDGELRLDPLRSLEVALRFEKGAADFCREYAAGFLETAGKQVLLRFADDEVRRCTSLASRIEQLVSFVSP
jgi:Fur family transcriptional regulator, ferric uptake regulator